MLPLILSDLAAATVVGFFGLLAWTIAADWLDSRRDDA